MRGTLKLWGSGVSDGGIIPAYAGNTCPLAGIRSYTWDHPRICGEHDVWQSFQHDIQGSSPHMRGTLEASGPAAETAGIIPAYAGNTLARACICLPHRDHPRICGEHRRADSQQPHGIGIIPAYAGNTSPPRQSPSEPRDHPRICGEHLSCSIALNDIKGSSPHMRGTLLSCQRSTVL